MPIHFEDEDESYNEGIDVFKKHIATHIDAELSSCATLSERTRTLTTQAATTSNRSPSPMDTNSDWEDMQVDKPINNSTATTYTAPPLMDVVQGRGIPAIAVPTKRPTGSELPSATSQSVQSQPAKRVHSTPEASPESDNAVSAELGTHLDSFTIAHDKDVQSLIDANELPWGTVYEIARGITKGQWKWSSITREKISKLRGTNAHATHLVTPVLTGKEGNVPPKTPATAELWREYDREQDAIMENKGRGLGGMGLWRDKEDWYGGRIQQVGRLVRQNEQGCYEIKLEKPEIRRSHRFSRFLGSRRILQVRVADDLLYKHGNEVRYLLSSRKFILCGRVYLPFHAKEGSMYLMETDQNFERAANNKDGDQFRRSLMDFIQWHNPLNPNRKQPISKWSTRWALGLSTSVPTIELEPQHIHEIPDKYVSPKDWEGKAPAEKVLTDGCGFINGAALTQIKGIMKYSVRPTAVQGRIGGSKGMWILHHDPCEQIPDGPAKIWIRPSQTKIELGDASQLGRAQRIFDLLAPSRMTTPARLSAQSLVNLSHSGIDHQILKELMAQGLKDQIQSLIDWTHSQSMVMVSDAVAKAGSIVMARLRRQNTAQARALGLGQLHPVDDSSLEDSNDDYSNHVCYDDSTRNKFSGAPLSLHETVVELLQAGFHPLKNDFLFKKLEHVIALVLDDYVEKFHIPIMESCEAYIVPDPYGVLKEGQIHFKSSEPILNPVTGEYTNIILGEVLVSRNPTRLPSDIQKVTAVACPQLSNHLNVIVFPVKGKQSLASFLGGGDYDGDTVMINWCKPLVKQFRGHPLCTAPTNLSNFFEREVEYVRDFDARISALGAKQSQEAFQNILLLGLAETRVGLYSKFHDAAVYECGYESEKAIHLAYMFTTCLDASKTGLRVKVPVFEEDRQKWGFKKPYYVSKLEGREKSIKDNSNIFKRQGNPFILDVLVDEGDRLRAEALQNYRKLQSHFGGSPDQDLSRPWKEAEKKAKEARELDIPGFAENMNAIKDHVKGAKDWYLRVVDKSPSDARELYNQIASHFAGPPAFKGFVFLSDLDISILKASLAYIECPSFAFSVAFHDICGIKARAATDHVTMSSQHAQCLATPGVVVRTYNSLAHET